MAVSKLNPATAAGDNWVEISSQTPTSGTTVSFSSISSSYKKLLLVVNNVLLSASDAGKYTFNSITTNYSYQYAASTSAAIELQSAAEIRTNTNNDRHSAYLLITNPSGTVPVQFEGFVAASPGATGRIIWQGVVPSLTTAVTSILCDYTAAISGSNVGTLKLYGTL